ncbi:MAG: alpha-glucuronidase [Mangrovibacterium sp.]
MNEPISNLNLFENPTIKLRLLNHWDNPGKIPAGRFSVERGYAGESIFKWEELPEINTRYTDYARMLASVGINGTVVNNVNTAGKGLEGWKLLTREYLPKLKALAAVFRGYGIKLYISVNFFSPVLIAGIQNADPLNPEVQEWWKNKVAEIYSEIPDFGGFLIKADSEGQPGPITYGRDHAEGANLLANALRPYGGLLIWRAFVYGKDLKLNPDRAFQAYEIFKPLDGQFVSNALVQIKNGPIDFQVREPVSPLFGAMPKSNQILELQITQEYTGQDRHVCYLVPQWKEVFQFDTYAKGPNSTITKIIDGSLFDYQYSGVAGVANMGSDLNWTGHHLAQANFYGYGRLAWDPDLSSEQITREWIIQTFNQNKRVVSVISDLLLGSWRTYEDYTSLLGVGVICGGGRGSDGHFYPAPAARVAYHRANSQGVGYDRTMATGSGYTSQYFEPNCSRYESLLACPDELLLFFHHVPYTHILQSGKTVIQHIYDSHNEGVKQVKNYQEQWESLKGLIDDERFEQVLNKLKQQVVFAEEWRDSINTYFYKLSGIEDMR